MIRPQGRLARVLHRGAQPLPASATPYGEVGVHADTATPVVARPTAVQLAIELAQSIGSSPRFEMPATSAAVDTRVSVADTESVH